MNTVVFDASGITARIKELVHRCDDTAAEFARRVGISDQTMRLYLNGSKPGAEKLATIARAVGVTTDWLLTGVDPVLPAPAAPDSYVSIPKIDIEMSEKNRTLTYVEDQNVVCFFKKNVISSMASNVDNCALIDIYGDTMYPEIRHGDTVMIDQGKTTIFNGMIYAICIEQHITVKKMENFHGNKFRVIPVNNEHYKPYLMPKSNINVIGQMIWLSRKTS